MGCTESSLSPATFFNGRVVEIIPKADPHLRVAVSGNGNANGVAIIFFPHRPNDPTQRFLINKRPDHSDEAVSFSPMNIRSRALDTTGNAGKQFVLWDAPRPMGNATLIANQSFILERTDLKEDGIYYIRWNDVGSGENLYWDVWGKLGVNAPLIACSPSGGLTQKFYLQLVDYASPNSVPSQSIPYFNQHPAVLQLPEHHNNPYNNPAGFDQHTSHSFVQGSRGKYTRPNVAFLAEGTVVEIAPKIANGRLRLQLEEGKTEMGTRLLACENREGDTSQRFIVHYRYGKRSTSFLPYLASGLAIDTTGERRKNLLAWTNDEANVNQAFILDPVPNNRHLFFIRSEKNQRLLIDVPEERHGSPVITRDSQLGGSGQQFRFIVIPREQLDAEKNRNAQEQEYKTADFFKPVLAAPFIHYQISGQVSPSKGSKKKKQDPISTTVLPQPWSPPAKNRPATQAKPTEAENEKNDISDSSSSSSSSSDDNSSSDEEEEKKREVPPDGSIIELIPKSNENARVEVQDADSTKNLTKIVVNSKAHGGYSQRFEVRHRNQGTSFVLSPLSAPEHVIDSINAQSGRQQVIFKEAKNSFSQNLVMEPWKNEENAEYFFFKLESVDDEEDDYNVWSVDDDERKSSSSSLTMKPITGNNHQLFKLLFVPEARVPPEGSLIEISPHANHSLRLTFPSESSEVTLMKKADSENDDIWKQRFIVHVREDVNGENFVVLSPVAFRSTVVDVFAANKAQRPKICLTDQVFNDQSQSFSLEPVAEEDQNVNNLFYLRWSANHLKVITMKEEQGNSTSLTVADRDGSVNTIFKITILPKRFVKLPPLAADDKKKNDNSNNHNDDDDDGEDPLSMTNMARIDSIQPGESKIVPTTSKLSPSKISANSVVDPDFSLPNVGDVFEIVPVAAPDRRVVVAYNHEKPEHPVHYMWTYRGTPRRNEVYVGHEDSSDYNCKYSSYFEIVRSGFVEPMEKLEKDEIAAGVAKNRYCLAFQANVQHHNTDTKQAVEVAGRNKAFRFEGFVSNYTNQIFSITEAGEDEEGDMTYHITFEADQDWCWTFLQSHLSLKKKNYTKPVKCQRFKFVKVNK